MNWRGSLHSLLGTSARCDHGDGSWRLQLRRDGAEETDGRTMMSTRELGKNGKSDSLLGSPYDQ